MLSCTIVRRVSRRSRAQGVVRKDPVVNGRTRLDERQTESRSGGELCADAVMSGKVRVGSPRRFRIPRSEAIHPP